VAARIKDFENARRYGVVGKIASLLADNREATKYLQLGSASSARKQLRLFYDSSRGYGLNCKIGGCCGRNFVVNPG
jgi:hypothetical protein